MPPKVKKRKKPPQATEAADSEEEQTPAPGPEDIIDVEFEFFEPKEGDFHGIKNMLVSGVWDFAEIDFSGLADSISNQGNIGTIVKADDGEASTAYALLTALNLRQFGDLAWAKSVKSELLKMARKHAPEDVHKNLEKLLKCPASGPEVGLLISERFVNLPLQISAALTGCLRDDIDWSCSTPECPEDERPFYRFAHFIGSTKGSVQDTASSSGAGDADAGSSKRRRASGGGVVPQMEEMEVFMKHADHTFSFPIPLGEHPAPGSGTGSAANSASGPAPAHRIVFVISRAKLDKASAELKGKYQQDPA